MKNIHNYLSPEELRKKLQNPSFRHDFLQWSRSHLCNPHNGRHRISSKSPNDRSQTHLSNHHSLSFNTQLNQSHNQSYNKQSCSKQNITPNSMNIHKSGSSLSKKNIKNPIPSDKKKAKQQVKAKPLPSQSKSHSFLQFNRHNQENKSSRINYSSLKKMNQSQRQNKNEKSSSRQISTHSNASKSKKKIEKFIGGKGATTRTNQNKKISFKYSYRTRQGALATNPNKTNQDRLMIKTNLNDSNKNMFAVADGHGAYGHIVSESIVSNMSLLLDQQFKKVPGQQKIYVDQPETIFPTIYNKLQKILTEKSQLNAQCSGSTLVSLCLEDQYITCANVGDSRAILARQVDKKSWEVIYLSQDQKPCVESEKKRILKYGGRVHALKDEKGQEVGPQRVWLPNQNIQGLAMSRSLGDNVSKPYGVTHRPQIIKIPTDKRDKFILIASDGVWQFISNQEVLQLLVPFYREKKLEQACDALLKLAYDRWTVQDTSVIDDITFILIFLQS